AAGRAPGWRGGWAAGGSRGEPRRSAGYDRSESLTERAGTDGFTRWTPCPAAVISRQPIRSARYPLTRFTVADRFRSAAASNEQEIRLVCRPALPGRYSKPAENTDHWTRSPSTRSATAPAIARHTRVLYAADSTELTLASPLASTVGRSCSVGSSARSTIAATATRSGYRSSASAWFTEKLPSGCAGCANTGRAGSARTMPMAPKAASPGPTSRLIAGRAGSEPPWLPAHLVARSAGSAPGLRSDRGGPRRDGRGRARSCRGGTDTRSCGRRARQPPGRRRPPWRWRRSGAAPSRARRPRRRSAVETTRAWPRVQLVLDGPGRERAARHPGRLYHRSP